MSRLNDDADLFFVDTVGDKRNAKDVKGAISQEEERLALALFGMFVVIAVCCLSHEIVLFV
jgi:hypothetical protein